ncbi:hypothetical protein ACFVXA_15470 [Streptomyces sp. NPDC058246]|uniref:hypothetical protein n=1 Tax=Streptomyces sp. NPDC058246 TaxID=3346400 RepID=UPI0036F077A2
MATPPPYQNAPQGNPFAPQGGYAPNGAPAAPAHGSFGTQDAYGTQNSAYGQNPAYGAQNPVYGAPNPAPGQNPYASAGGYAPAPPLTPACRICATQPAGDMTIRQHTGLLVAMRFSKMEGPFCRSCATAIHREMTTKTLAGGWWSPVSLALFTPLTLLWNLYVRTKIRKLAHPTTPSPTGVVMDQGKPVFQRPLAYVVLLLPLLWLAAYISNEVSS